MVAPRKIKTPRIVRRNNGVRLFGIFVLGMLLGAVGWLAFDYGREWAGFSAGQAGRTAKRLRAAVAALERERDELRQQIVALERSSQIDREATRVAREEYRRLQDETQEQVRKTEFFRSLVQEGGAGSLRTKGFELFAVAGERVYGYRFTIRQVKEDFGVSEGEVLILVEGAQDGERKTLGPEKVKMRFRHFQRIEGKLRLPDGFDPVALVVDVQPISKNLAALKQRFEWQLGGD